MLDGAPLLLVCGGIVMVLSKLMERALAESAMDGSRDTYGRVEVCTLLYVVLRSRCKQWAICDLDMYYTLSLIIQNIFTFSPFAAVVTQNTTYATSCPGMS